MVPCTQWVLCGCLLTGLGSSTAPYLEDKKAEAQIVNNLQEVTQPIEAVPRLAPGCLEAQVLALASWQEGQLSGLGREHRPRLPIPESYNRPGCLKSKGLCLVWDSVHLFGCLEFTL